MQEIEVIKENITRHIAVPNRNLEILKKHFGQCFDKNGTFNHETFKKHLAENEVNFSTESYGLEWLGKSYARLLATDPATTLLKADETHNRKPENAHAQHLLIKGDNLEVLKHLVQAYYEKIKMIYIDPPYNTGNDGFVYQDNRKFTVKELSELAGISEEKAQRILDFTQSKSNSHSAWLTFMYPRLYIARHLLREDGVIFVSIDDNEVAQLRLMMDEIFGEENFVGVFLWKKNKSGNQNLKYISIQHEYIVVYVKQYGLEKWTVPYSNDDLKDYDQVDDKGIFYWKTAKHSTRGRDIKITYNGKEYLVEKCIYTEKTIKKMLDEGEAELRTSPSGSILYKKQRLGEGILPYSFLDSNKFPMTEDATEHVSELFNGSSVFDNPKPAQLVEFFVKISTKETDIILDFFAGSGTTGDAVMQLNAEDGDNRKYILVQLPEPIDPKKNKVAYDFVKNELGVAQPTIFDITKERLIRAAKKIKTEMIDKKIAEKQKELRELEGKLELEEKKERIKQLKAEIKALEAQDLGFKVFETIPIWEDYLFEAEDYESSQTLFDTSKLTEEDLQALLITWKTYDGVSLTQDVEKVDLRGYTAYYGKGKLYLMYKGFKTEHLKAILERIDTDRKFEPRTIIAFGYHFESARLRELAENVRTYNNKKKTDIKFIARY
jgi:adenine-specific DNA-methyltransferase